MAPLPLTKLVGLVIKAVTKPVAKRFKTEAANNDRFRGVCRAVGRSVHTITGNVNNFMIGRFVAAPPLSDSAAVSLGAEVLGEGIVVAVAAGIVVVEYARSNASKRESEERSKAKRAAAERRLALRFEELEMRLHHVEQLVNAHHVVLPNPHGSHGQRQGVVLNLGTQGVGQRQPPSVLPGAAARAIAAVTGSSRKAGSTEAPTGQGSAPQVPGGTTSDGTGAQVRDGTKPQAQPKATVPCHGTVPSGAAGAGAGPDATARHGDEGASAADEVTSGNASPQQVECSSASAGGFASLLDWLWPWGVESGGDGDNQAAGAQPAGTADPGAQAAQTPRQPPTRVATQGTQPRGDVVRHDNATKTTPQSR